MRTPTEHIKTLQRRIDFLKSREHINSFDKAEVGSLEWALVNLSAQPKEPEQEISKELLLAITNYGLTLLKTQHGYELRKLGPVVAFGIKE